MGRQIVRAFGVVAGVILWRLASEAVIAERRARGRSAGGAPASDDAGGARSAQGDEPVADRLSTFRRRRERMEIERRMVRTRGGRVAVVYQVRRVPRSAALLSLMALAGIVYVLTHPVDGGAWIVAGTGLAVALFVWIGVRLRAR